MEPPAWLDELGLRPGPPWHAMGTRALPAGGWPADPADADAQLARKAQLLATRRRVVSAALADAATAAAASEAAELVAAAAGRSVVAAGVAGDAPLEAAARVVPDDLCVLVARDGHWRLDAGVVCFPSMWSIGEKLGRPMAEVHAPVPAYAEELAERVDRFLDRLAPGRPVWRRNWAIHVTDELHLPSPPAPRVVGARDVPAALWLRSERQTLRRLPRTGAVLFTIRTQQAPLAVLAGRPDVAAGIAASVRSWSEALVAYRGAGAWRAPVLAWLDRLAA